MASLAAVLAAAGCKDGGTPPPPPTSATGAPAPVTPEALKGALLVESDVPGAKPSASQAQDFDYSACFPGNPLGAAAYAGEVESADLELFQGGVRRNFASSARPATTEQATEFVATVSSAAGSACVVEALKRGITRNLSVLTIDASGLAGTSSAAAVADGGAVLAIGGNLISEGRTVPASFDLVFFRKGSLLVLVALGALGGAGVPAQAVELAQRVASRLP